MNISHLIFDCDGVIVDSEIVATRLSLKVLSAYGYVSDEESHCRRFSGMLTSKIMEIIFDELGKPVPESLVQDMDHLFETEFEKVLEPIPGMPELLRSQTLPLSIVSNSWVDSVRRSLSISEISSVSEGRIYSAEHVPNPKPAPDVYQLAMTEIGLPAAQLLVVEDSVAGVTAAKAAGLTVIGFLGASHIFEGHDTKLKAQGVDYLASDANELSALLQTLL